MSNEVPRIFDREIYLSRQAKASPMVLADLHGHVRQELSERLSLVTRKFDHGLLLGHTAFEATMQDHSIRKVTVYAAKPSEDLNLAENAYDIIVSLLNLQTVNDVPGYLIQLSRALQPDGLLMIAFFAGETLTELRESWLSAEVEVTGGATPRVAPMISIRELGGLLQRAGLALPVADIVRTTVRYDDPFRLMLDIKSLGFANPLVGRARNLSSRRLLTQMASQYREKFGDSDGRIRATIEIAWANAWKPHPSQPQALKPGSAKARLADALKVPETKL